MKEFLVVLKHTFIENLRKKAFIISTVIMLIIVVGIVLLPAIITGLNGSNNVGGGSSTSEKSIIYVVDKSKYFESRWQDVQKGFTNYQLVPEKESGIENLKKSIKENGNSYLLVLNMVDDYPEIEYYTNQYDSGPSRENISDSVKNAYITAMLKDAKVSNDVITKVTDNLEVNVKELGKNRWGGYFTSILIVMLLFFAIYFYGYGVSMSVASEKTSRVMELLVTSVKPSRIILGKTAGMGILGLSQLVLIIASGSITYKLAFPEEFNISGMSFDLSAFTPLSLTLIIVYFILGYTLYALLYAVVGATVSKAEDLNSAMMPMSFVALISFYFSYGTFAVPDSKVAKVVSLIPLTSAFSVPSRLISTTVPMWEVVTSLLILITFIILVGIISIKLYSFAVLHYGDRLKISTLFKMSKNA